MKPTHVLREHHDELMRKIHEFEQFIDRLPSLKPEELKAALQPQVEFLVSEIKSHARSEEQYLYPEVDFLTNPSGMKNTATMRIDHEYIAAYIDRLAEMVPGISPKTVPQFQRLAWELVAIMKLHFDKEERVYLPLLDNFYSEEEIERRISSKMENDEMKEGKKGRSALLTVGAPTGFDYT
jgi:hemerythrin-like domain-containing protein